MLAALLLAAAPVAIASKTDLLEFEYSWSAEANAIPALRRRFQADAARQRAEHLRIAHADRRERATSGDPPRAWSPYTFDQSWTTAGQTSRLLSLQGGVGTYTGGAHPNSGSMSLLWDRRLNRELKLDNLLLRSGWWNGAIRQPFCTLLNRERIKRRNEQPRAGDMFWNCPELKELTLTLADKKSNGRFDHVEVTADAYVAGPYAEGAYEISLPITATMIARLKPAYRSSFEPQPPVQ